ELVVVESTLSNNIDNGIDAYEDTIPSSVTVINSTITGNGQVGGSAVLLYNLEAVFTHVTIYQNANDGLVADYANVVINNSILAGNGEDCISYGDSVEINNSLVQEDAEFDPCGVTDGVDGNIVGEDPFLALLGNYGGPTQT